MAPVAHSALGGNLQRLSPVLRVGAYWHCLRALAKKIGWRRITSIIGNPIRGLRR
jgi:hypothetical protein